MANKKTKNLVTMGISCSQNFLTMLKAYCKWRRTTVSSLLRILFGQYMTKHAQAYVKDLLAEDRSSSVEEAEEVIRVLRELCDQMEKDLFK